MNSVRIATIYLGDVHNLIQFEFRRHVFLSDIVTVSQTIKILMLP